MEYYSPIEKNEITPLAATWMHLEIIILSQVSYRERQIPNDITYMWNLKYDTNELIYETDSQRTDLWLSRRRRTGGGKNWESGIHRCKLLYTDQINKALMYSTGNNIQYSVINHNGKKKTKKQELKQKGIISIARYSFLSQTQVEPASREDRLDFSSHSP